MTLTRSKKSKTENSDEESGSSKENILLYSSDNHHFSSEEEEDCGGSLYENEEDDDKEDELDTSENDDSLYDENIKDKNEKRKFIKTDDPQNKNALERRNQTLFRPEDYLNIQKKQLLNSIQHLLPLVHNNEIRDSIINNSEAIYTLVCNNINSNADFYIKLFTLLWPTTKINDISFQTLKENKTLFYCIFAESLVDTERLFFRKYEFVIHNIPEFNKALEEENEDDKIIIKRIRLTIFKKLSYKFKRMNETIEQIKMHYNNFERNSDDENIGNINDVVVSDEHNIADDSGGGDDNNIDDSNKQDDDNIIITRSRIRKEANNKNIIKNNNDDDDSSNIRRNNKFSFIKKTNQDGNNKKKRKWFKFPFGGENFQTDDDVFKKFKFSFKDDKKITNEIAAEEMDEDDDYENDDDSISDDDEDGDDNNLKEQGENLEQPTIKKRYYLYIICDGYNNSSALCKIGFSTADDDNFFGRKNHYWPGSRPRFCTRFVILFLFSIKLLY
jgi:hypothetical protein